MAQKGQKRPKKISEKYKSITKLLKKVQILPSEAAKKCLKLSQIFAKGPTVNWGDMSSRFVQRIISLKANLVAFFIDQRSHKSSHIGENYLMVGGPIPACFDIIKVSICLEIPLIWHTLKMV